MRCSRLFSVLAVVGVALGGCGMSALFRASSGVLPVTNIRIDTARGPAIFRVEVADTPASQEKGLMYRREMAPDAGMLFDFRKPRFLSFWMKNTYIPLDLLFVRADGTISSVEPNAVPLSTDSIRSTEPVQVVIELNGGRAYDLGIKPGARVHAAIFGD